MVSGDGAGGTAGQQAPELAGDPHRPGPASPPAAGKVWGALAPAPPTASSHGDGGPLCVRSGSSSAMVASAPEPSWRAGSLRHAVTARPRNPRPQSSQLGSNPRLSLTS